MASVTASHLVLVEGLLEWSAMAATGARAPPLLLLLVEVVVLVLVVVCVLTLTVLLALVVRRWMAVAAPGHLPSLPLVSLLAVLLMS